VPTEVSDPLTGGSVARGLGAAETIRWPLKRSSELFELRYGKALVEPTRRPGAVPVYGTNGQTGSHDTALFKGPGIIIGRKGAGHLGVHWSEGDYWVIDTAYALVPNSEVDLKFAYFLVKHVGLNHLKHGTSNPSLTRDAFGAQYFPVPPIEAQHGIAATLGALDDKIESNRRAIAISLSLLDLMAQQTEESLPAVPLSSLVSLDKQKANPAKLLDEAVDHYSLPAFDEGGLAEHVAPVTIMSNKTLVRTKSVLISRLNPRIERFWWVTPAKGFPALASTEFAVLSAGSELELAGAWLAVRSPMFREVLPMRVTGTSGSHQRVRPEDLLAIEVPDTTRLPEDQKKTALFLLTGIEQARQEIAKLEALRDALLPELISGRIRVPEAAEAIA
jgi:type I restriction enzyme S subunit